MEEKWVFLWLTGDMDGFTAFYRAHYAGVLAQADRRLLDHEDAEELTAVVFRTAWKRVAEGGELTEAWLDGVLFHLIGNARRAKKRRDALVLKATSALEDLAVMEEAEFERRERVREVVQALPARHRDVLMRKYWDGDKAAEISRDLGISEGTAGVRVFRARKAFEKEWNAVHGGGESDT